jgi:hypothetical protein
MTALSTLPRGTRIRHDGREWKIYGAHRGRVLLLSAVGTREVDASVCVEVVSGRTSPTGDVALSDGSARVGAT